MMLYKSKSFKTGNIVGINDLILFYRERQAGLIDTFKKSTKKNSV